MAGAAYLANLAGIGPLLRRELGGRGGLGGIGALNPFGVLTAEASTVQPASRTADFTITAERDSDLVLLDFEFYGFGLRDLKGVATLVPTAPAASGTAGPKSNLVVVTLPPQCIGEAAYPVDVHSQSAQSYGSTAPLPVDAPPVVSAVGGPSRLVFTLPDGVDVPLPNMSAEDLLDWSNWVLLVPPAAQVNPPGRPNGSGLGSKGYPLPDVPGDFETAIEFPYALFIAPIVYVSGAGGLNLPKITEDLRARYPLSDSYATYFTTRTKPLYNGKVADLWTATLGRTDSAAGNLAGLPAPAPQVAAVWASDMFYEATFAPPPPSATQADEIVYQQPQPK